MVYSTILDIHNIENIVEKFTFEANHSRTNLLTPTPKIGGWLLSDLEQHRGKGSGGDSGKGDI